MADSDDEYDRKRRDKFRGERSSGDAFRTERRDERRPLIGGGGGGGGLGGRDDWPDRGNPFRSSSGGASGGGGGGGGGGGRPRTEYRDYRTPRDRYGSPGREMPPAKRMRPDWGDDMRSNPRFGGYDPYLMHAWNEHYAHSLHSAYSHAAHAAIPRENAGGGVGGNSDTQTQPAMMTLKQFLDTQDDGISDSEVLRKYTDYKTEFKRQQLNEFFVAHKDEEWFKHKYHPEESVKRKEEQFGFLKKRTEVFNELLENGTIATVKVDSNQSDALIRLLDTVVIKLEGGTDDDLKILDEKPREPSFSERKSESERTSTKPSEKDDDVIITSFVKKNHPVVEDEVLPVVVSPRPVNRPQSDEENWDDDDEDDASAASNKKPESPKPAVEAEKSKKKKTRKRKRSDDSSASSASESDSSSSSSDEEDDEKLKNKYDLEAANEETKDEAEKTEEQEKEIKAEEKPKEEDVEKIDDNVETDEKKNGIKNEDEEIKQNDKETDNDKDKDVEMNDINKDEEQENKPNDIKTKDEEGEEDGEKEKDDTEKKDTVTTTEEGETVEENKKTEDEQPETIDLDKLKEGPQPRALHRTSSIFLRNLAPAITKAEIEAICQRFSGYLRVAIADPLVERRWYRRGWITFQRDVNIKEICWNLNNQRLRDCEMGAIVNRDLSRRVRPANGITAHKNIVRADIKLCAKIAMYLDERFNLWNNTKDANSTENANGENETEKTANNEVGNSASSCYGFKTNNPVLQNITDFLIEEASAEEEELLGISGDQKDGDGDSLERDESLISVLDRLVLYLRIVHSVDYYNHCEYPYEDEMPNRCGIIHARGPAPAKATANELQDYNKTFEGKLSHFLTKVTLLNDEDIKNLGAKDSEVEVEKFIQANTQELAKDKWLCPLSGKKFKGPEFIRKHIFNKHEEKVLEVKKEVEYFNNYLRDPKRPQLPEHPGTSKRTNSESSGGPANVGGGGVGGYRGPMFPPSFAAPPYGFGPMILGGRGRGGSFGGGRRPGGHDYRPRSQYRDLDAPQDPY